MAPEQPSRRQKIAIGIMTVAAFGFLILEWAWVSYDQIDTIPFSQFEKLVAEGSVAEVAVGSDTIQGKVKDKLPSGKSAFVTARVDAALAEKLETKGIVVRGVPSGGLFQSILLWILPLFMFYVVWFFISRRFSSDRQGFGGFMSIGKSRAKVYVETHQGDVCRRGRRR
jgi:cell division protease FtsH